MAFDDDDADQDGDGECREQAPPHLVPAGRVHRHQVLTGRCYSGVRLRLGRGVHPVGQGSRSARVGPGTDKLVGIMAKIPRPCYEIRGR